MRKLPEDYIIRKIKEFLDEDLPDGDITTESIFKKHHYSKNHITAILQAEEDLIFAGEQLLPYFFDNKCEIKLFAQDGNTIKNNEVIAEINGLSDLILSRERVMLNLMQRLCGIATLTKKYSDIAKPYSVKILDTRKTTPGLRLFEKYAVTVGGGYNHRLDLSSGILIKDNHIKAAGGIKNAIELAKSNKKNLKVEIEVENLQEIKEALEVGVDGFLLDNMNPQKTKEMVNFIRSNGNKEIFIESSGGINLENLKDYVTTGVNAISSGALTHSVKSSNIHLEFKI
ncbi:carboxylating nicotinate-nucleotide diphosphorylase [Bacteroidetes/Chlorobi group bacterium ChocPot_Mid]|nr:MAG: carboxylating nicotinate-nucleotide diphosphorylase [Bacteroidetes/Chlorobi group bacterium ChocPot_Mid]